MVYSVFVPRISISAFDEPRDRSPELLHARKFRALDSGLHEPLNHENIIELNSNVMTLLSTVTEGPGGAIRARRREEKAVEKLVLQQYLGLTRAQCCGNALLSWDSVRWKP